MVYLLIGQDVQAKETFLNKLKREFLSKELQDFNFDTLYGKETDLKKIQERLLAIPLQNPKRLIIIKDAESLGEDERKFLLSYCKKPDKQLVVVFDFQHYDYKDALIKGLSPLAKVLRCKEEPIPDTFVLNRQIELRNADSALRILDQLLRGGQAPERILGGLRYAWEKQSSNLQEAKKKLKLLLSCDIEMKTGRLKPAFALEKLIIKLCGFGQPPRKP